MTTSSRDASGIIWVGQLKCNPGRLDRSVVTSTDCFVRLSIHRLQQFKDSLENGDLNGHNMAQSNKCTDRSMEWKCNFANLGNNDGQFNQPIDRSTDEH